MKYKVAEDERDFEACKKLARTEGLPEPECIFPTIMAIDEYGLAGFIATAPRSDMVLAGPLVLRSDRVRTFTALRLCLLYQKVMTKLGIVSVIFGASPGSLLDKGIRRWFPNVTPYASDGESQYYVWKINVKGAA